MLGVITEKHPENYDVDIRGPSKALLPALAFEGATRRNRPHLQVRTQAWGGRGGGGVELQCRLGRVGGGGGGGGTWVCVAGGWGWGGPGGAGRCAAE